MVRTILPSSFRAPPGGRVAIGLVLALGALAGCSHSARPPVIASHERAGSYATDDFAIDVGKAREAIRQDRTCHQLFETLQAMVKRGEAAARMTDKAQFDVEMGAIEAWLDAQPKESCPSLQGVLASQRVLCRDARVMFGMLHDADQTDPNYASRLAHYMELHDQASVEALLQQSLAWEAWRQQGSETPLAARQQRYFINAGTDAYIVREDGSVGAAQTSPPYVGLVHTPVLSDIAGRYVALQGQGPLSTAQSTAYAHAAMAFAVQQHATNVLFVNTAGGQIPSFADAVASASRSSVIDAAYLEYTGWQDGKLVTPADAARFADEVATALASKGKRSLLVVNCNAGLDRSGTINTLTQLILSAREQRAEGHSFEQIANLGHEAIDTVVASLKRAKPHSISSPGRYLFLHSAWQAWVETHRTEVPVVAPVSVPTTTPASTQK